MKKQKNILTYIILVIILLIVCLPLASMIGTSFKTEQEALRSSSLLPVNPTTENYDYVINKTSFPGSVVNSLIISLIVTITCTSVAAFAGYALSRFKGKVFGAYKIILYLLQMIPMVLLLIPLFLIMRTVKLYDTLYSLIISYTAINLPICIWMLKGFFDTIPYEIEESARIDGCGRFRTFFNIIIPVSIPGITSVGILSFVYAWNEYMLASIFIRTEEIHTLTVSLSQFSMQNTIIWSQLTTATTLGILPAILFIAFAQKYIINGLVAGAVKG